MNKQARLRRVGDADKRGGGGMLLPTDDSPSLDLTRGRYYLLRHSSLSGRPSPVRHDISPTLLCGIQSERHSIPRYQNFTLQWRLQRPKLLHASASAGAFSHQTNNLVTREQAPPATTYEPRYFFSNICQRRRESDNEI